MLQYMHACMSIKVHGSKKIKCYGKLIYTKLGRKYGAGLSEGICNSNNKNMQISYAKGKTVTISVLASLQCLLSVVHNIQRNNVGFWSLVVEQRSNFLRNK